jgi:predicted transcriptional regulator
MSPRAAARLESLGFAEVYDYEAGKNDWMAAGLPIEGENARWPRAGDVARKDVPRTALKERLGEVRDRVKAANWDAAVVVNEDGVVLGLLRATELSKDGELSIEDAMRPGPSTYRPYVAIAELAKTMTEHNVESSPITTSNGKLVGLLLKADAVHAAAEIK